MSGYIPIRFAKGITLNEVNPDDVALKCPYMNNLIATSMQILPLLNQKVKEIKIIKGFVGKAKLEQEYKGSTVPSDLRKHTQGLSLMMSWRDYSKSYAVTVFNEIYNEIKEKFKIVIKSDCCIFSQELEDRIIQEEYIKDDKKMIRTIKK